MPEPEVVETATQQPQQTQPAQQADPLKTAQEQMAEGGIITPKTDFDEFLSNAPVVEGQNPETVQKGEQAVDDEYLVRAGQESGQQDNNAQPNGDKADPTQNAAPEADKGEVIKVGDVEMTPEEWLTAKKYYDNYEKWNSRLNRESEMVKHFTDEQLRLVVPYASKQKPLPDNLAEEALKAPDIPKTIEITDEDGDTVEIKTSQLPKELIEALAKNAFIKAYPEVEEAQKQYNEMKQKYDELAERYKQANDSYATQMTAHFMKDHPNVAISIRKGENFSDVFSKIISNPLHPEYSNAMRFKLVIDNMRDTGSSMEDSYQLIFGKADREKEIKQKILQNQQTTVAPINSQIPVQTPDEQEVANLINPRVAKANQLFGRG